MQKSLGESIEEVIELMKQSGANEKNVGVFSIVGYTNDETLETLKNLIPSKDYLIMSLDEVNEKSINPRRFAKDNDFNIVLTCPLSSEIDNRESYISDFRFLNALEQDASVIIGITKKAITINKNRYGKSGLLNNINEILTVLP